MPRFGRSAALLPGAVALVLVAAAVFLILGLGSRSGDASSLPVIQLGQTAAGQSGQSGGSTGSTGAGQAQTNSTGSPATTSLPPSTTGSDATTAPTTTGGVTMTTASTVREIVNGGVRGGTSGHAGSGGNSTAQTGGR